MCTKSLIVPTQFRLSSLMLCLVLISYVAPVRAWNYFHIGFCNYSSFPMEYRLSFSPYNDFYNNNIFNIPLSGIIEAGKCTPSVGPNSWSVSDDTTFSTDYLSFRIRYGERDACFTLVNPWADSPYL